MAAEPTIKLENLFERVGFKPHSETQWDYCRSTARFNIPCCGRRWGKSQAAGHRITYKMFVPDSYNWIVGPTYKLGEKEFRVVYNDFKKLGLLKHCRKNYAVMQGVMRIETQWGSVLEVVSADKTDSLLGEGLDHVCMSEAATHDRRIWEQFIEPALSDKRGTADFPSTPRGYNWYHGMFNLGQDPLYPDYKSWTLPTWTNTARYPLGEDDPEIQRIRENSSQSYFDQEYGAKFTSFTGQIYEEWNENIHVHQIPYNPHYQNYLVFDYGFSNPFVALDIMVDQSDNVYVWREYYARHKSTFEHAQVLKERKNPPGYHVDAMYGDPRGADEAATIALVLGFVISQPVPWKHGVEEIKRLLKPKADGFPRLVVDPSCANTIRQMEQLHVAERFTAQTSKLDLNEHAGDGNIQHKADDHAADALRYFIGPFYVLGLGNHFSDVYDYSPEFHGSESEAFLSLQNSITLGKDYTGGMLTTNKHF